MIALPAPAEHGNETRTLLSTNTEPVDESAIVLEAEDVGRVRLPSSTSASRSILNLAATVSDIPIIVGCSSLATTDIDDSAGLGGSSVVESGQRGDAERLPGGCSGGEVPQMREPHISTLYEKQDVMAKHFGVTPEQALRTQALLRLGVTDEDVRIAERLMATRSTADNAQSKAEILLGYTVKQMSYQKALEVLGVSEAVVEEERARRLGELGLGLSQGSIIHEGEDICGGFFIKRRRSASQDGVSLGTTLSGEVAFGPTHVRVMQLEEVCTSQLNRIQELEQQLAALTSTFTSPSKQ